MSKKSWLRLVGAVLLIVVQWPSASNGAPRRKSLLPQKTPVQICVDHCNSQRLKAVRACEDPTCEQAAGDTAALCQSDCYLPPEQREARASHPAHILGVKHHPQSTPVWCWAASVAMVAEFLTKRPVSDCDVASRLDRGVGGEGFCCDSRGKLLQARCFRGRGSPDVTMVMSYYGLNPTQLNRPLTWDEVRQSIDSGHPIVIGLQLDWSGHAEVIVGYRAPGTLLLLDPWQGRMQRPSEASYLSLAGDGTMADSWRGNHPWAVSWVFAQDLAQGASAPQVTRSSHHAARSELAGGAAPTGPARSTVLVAFPLLNGAAKAHVDKGAAARVRTVGACYDDALAHGAQLPSPATVKLSFGVEQATPSFIMTRDSAGLPKGVVECISTAFAGWNDLFPSGGFDDTQRVEMTFQKLP